MVTMSDGFTEAMNRLPGWVEETGQKNLVAQGRVRLPCVHESHPLDGRRA